MISRTGALRLVEQARDYQGGRGIHGNPHPNLRNNPNTNGGPKVTNRYFPHRPGNGTVYDQIWASV